MAIRTVLSVAWLAVALVVLVSTISDMSLGSWRPAWLALGVSATLLSGASATFLFLQPPSLRLVAVASSVVFLVYWIYLFLIAPPDAINRYSLTGAGVILLAISTMACITFDRKPRGDGHVA